MGCELGRDLSCKPALATRLRLEHQPGNGGHQDFKLRHSVLVGVEANLPADEPAGPCGYRSGSGPVTWELLDRQRHEFVEVVAARALLDRPSCRVVVPWRDAKVICSQEDRINKVLRRQDF